MPFKYFVDGQGSGASMAREFVTWTNNYKCAMRTYAEAACDLKSLLEEEARACALAADNIPKRYKDVDWIMNPDADSHYLSISWLLSSVRDKKVKDVKKGRAA